MRSRVSIPGSSRAASGPSKTAVTRNWPDSASMVGLTRCTYPRKRRPGSASVRASNRSGPRFAPFTFVPFPFAPFATSAPFAPS